ncbi:protein hypothetical protein [Limosa lapponica baueri]|uniref:UDENN domain-containing protein n=1 Tax=Limosa lapponica baueri TaxID=1758121 RepID=A0A2I0TDR3_LIMLA|nr:protein hypothetical protein [Limosa lapponica baueri]
MQNILQNLVGRLLLRALMQEIIIDESVATAVVEVAKCSIYSEPAIWWVTGRVLYELVHTHASPVPVKYKKTVTRGGLGDTQFSFRLRQSGGQRSAHYEDDGEYNREAPLTLQRESAHYFGYVYFRQVKDSSMKRGYFQKSLVLVSRLPYVNLFQSLLQLIAPEYFDKLEPCLEAVCNEIDQWPPPVPGQTLNLPVMGVVIQVRIPSRVDKPGSSPVKQFNQENLLPAPMVLPSIHELDLFRCFQPVLIHVQMLWELMLLGEPIVVMAPSPTVSSEMVLALTSCLAPLRYCCDYRPYFTIHDSEFKEYTTRTQAPPNIVVGVTNPFFIKTLQHWPHILRVGELRMSGKLAVEKVSVRVGLREDMIYDAQVWDWMFSSAQSLVCESEGTFRA